MTLRDATAEFQRWYIRERIFALKGNIKAVAKDVGINRENLYRKAKALGMSLKTIAQEARRL